MPGSGTGLPVLVFGAGQLALQAWRILRDNGRNVCAFVVDDAYLPKPAAVQGVPVVPSSSLTRDYPPSRFEVFVAIGYRRMRLRREVYDRVRAGGYECPNAISAHALIDPTSRLGNNNLIFPGCIVESDVSIGDNNTVWSGAILCHDSRIGNHNFLAPRVTIAGNCSIEDLCFLGVGSLCVDGLTVRAETYLRAGTALLSSSDGFGKYAGNPAHKIGEIDQRVGILIGPKAPA